MLRKNNRMLIWLTYEAVNLPSGLMGYFYEILFNTATCLANWMLIMPLIFPEPIIPPFLTVMKHKTTFEE